jgi:hypothetical protein
MNYISFQLPPFPTFIKGGQSIFTVGKKHIRRTYWVYDLLYIKKGTLYITEGEKEFSIREGEYIILIPGREHFGTHGCDGDTHIFWLHFTIEDAIHLDEAMNIDWSTLSLSEGNFEEPAMYNFYLPQYDSLNQREHIEQLLQTIVSIEDEHSPDYLTPTKRIPRAHSSATKTSNANSVSYRESK